MIPYSLTLPPINPPKFSAGDLVWLRESTGALCILGSPHRQLKLEDGWSEEKNDNETEVIFGDWKYGYMVIGPRDVGHNPTGLIESAFTSTLAGDENRHLLKYLEEKGNPFRMEKRLHWIEWLRDRLLGQWVKERIPSGMWERKWKCNLVDMLGQVYLVDPVMPEQTKVVTFDEVEVTTEPSALMNFFRTKAGQIGVCYHENRDQLVLDVGKVEPVTVAREECERIPAISGFQEGVPHSEKIPF